MRMDGLEHLIDRLFGERPEALPSADATEVADLAAFLDQPGRPPAANDADPAEVLAAWLDGGLDGAERTAFEVDLAHAPDERADLQAARSFLDAVTAHPEAAPADLVDAAVATLPRLRGGAREGVFAAFARWLRGRPWTLGAVGGGVAVAFSVVLVVSANLGSATTQPFLPYKQPRSDAVASSPDSRDRDTGGAAADKTAHEPAVAPAVAPVGGSGGNLPAIPATPAAAPQAAPPVTSASPAAAAAAAARALEEYRAQQSDMLGATQGDEPSMSAGASAYSAEEDPCAPPSDSETKAASADKSDSAAHTHRDANCDKGYADRSFGSGPDVGTAPADAAAMPAAPASPMDDGATPPPQPTDTGPH